MSAEFGGIRTVEGIDWTRWEAVDRAVEGAPAPVPGSYRSGSEPGTSKTQVLCTSPVKKTTLSIDSRSRWVTTSARFAR